MTSGPKVLAITKRTADLCATQGMLYSAGFQLVTATSVALARGLVSALHIRGVIVCACSWTAEERARISSELGELTPTPVVMMHCPGCTGCDEVRGCPGTLRDKLPLTRLIETLGAAKR